MVSLGHVSLDGSKFKADTSKHKTMSYGRLKEKEKELTDEIEALIKKAEQSDKEEDTEYHDKTGYEIPEELKIKEKTTAGQIRSLLRYDLSTIPAGARVTSATAWFYVTLNNNVSSVYIHPVTARTELSASCSQPVPSVFYIKRMPPSPVPKSVARGRSVRPVPWPLLR